MGKISDHRYYCRFIGHSATYYWFSSCFDVCQSISHAKNSFDACSNPHDVIFCIRRRFFKLFYEPTFGIVSYLLSAFTEDRFVVLGSPAGAIAGIVIADAWMWSPFVMLLVLAGLVSVPKYLYEAAEIDRASSLRRFWTITFPYIKSLLLLAVLFRTIETFKLFDIVYIITEGGPGSSTETIAVYLYRTAFQFFKTSQSSALAYIVLFIVVVMTNLYLYAVNRRAEEVG